MQKIAFQVGFFHIRKKTFGMHTVKTKNSDKKHLGLMEQTK